MIIKRVFYSLVLSHLLIGCDYLTKDFSGHYQREEASPFEIAQEMNYSADIKQLDQNHYQLVLNSGWGPVSRMGELKGKNLVLEDNLVVRVNGNDFELFDLNSPDVIFKFSRETK